MMKRLIESFDLVTGMDIVGDDYWVFTVGRHDPTKPWFPFKQLDVSVEGLRIAIRGKSSLRTCCCLRVRRCWAGADISMCC